jgi:hypothetical protein
MEKFRGGERGKKQKQRGGKYVEQVEVTCFEGNSCSLCIGFEKKEKRMKKKRNK